MSNRLLLYVSAISVQALLAVGQITLKIFAVRLSAAGLKIMKDPAIFLHVALPASIAVIIYVTAAALWVFVLQNMPVNRAFLFVSLAFVFVPILSYFVLREEIGFGVILGTALIVSGILVGVLL